MRGYKANMIPGGVTPTINVSQYDNDYAVTVTLIEGAEIYTPPAGATIRVEGTKPDGHGFEYPCTYQGNVVTMPIYTQMTVVSGRFPIELVVYQSGLRVGSCNIIFAVERAPLGEDTDISETVIPDIIAGAQAQADAAAASATQAAASAESAETAKTAAMDAAQDAIDAAQELQTAVQFNAALIHETASGAVASFADGADNIPMKSIVAEITPVQEGSGDPSPTNIRPISGRTGLTVTHANKNLMPNMAGTATNTTNGITYTYNDDGSFTINGTATANAYSRAVDGVATNIYLPHGTYKKPTMQNGNVGIYVQYMKSSSSWTTVTGGETLSQTFVIDEDYPLAIRVAVMSGTTVNNVRFEPYIYPDSVSDTTWVSPVKTNYPISWQTEAGTIYGGTLDVVSGVLTVTHFGIRLTSTNHSWSSAGNASTGMLRYYCTLNPAADASTQEVMCSHARNVSGNASPWGTCFLYNGIFAMKNGDVGAGFSTLADFRTWLDENNLQVCYKLATPQTYQLTPTEVRTILGGNNIYTDAGDVSVEYIADTKMYIDNKIAELQALVLEN